MKLGFGLMRLPKDAEGKIDIEQTKEMVDLFMEAGGTYFDTAYAYPGSEEAIREALVKRYPRESYTLATKLVAWAQGLDEEKAKDEFRISLERTGAGYFDYYLLHALRRNNYKKYDEYHIWDYVKELKEKGLVKNYGFSFHGDPELLEELLNDHPDVDFVQLQINYADWESASAHAREFYEIVRRHDKPITVMEPVKGGLLADPLPAVKEVLKAADPDASLASWAIRYVASLDGILAVLSGMSNVEQMKDNLSFMKDFKPLSEEEQEVIKKAQEALLSNGGIPCTGCHYCTEGCPMQIPIPEIFAARNREVMFREDAKALRDYKAAVENCGKASDCIGCLQCEGACPQGLPITTLLQSIAEAYEEERVPKNPFLLAP